MSFKRVSSNGRAGVFQTPDVGSIPTIRSNFKRSSRSGSAEPCQGSSTSSTLVDRSKFGVVIANGKQPGLHPGNESSILSDSTNCGRGRVVRRRVVAPFTGVQFSPVTPVCGRSSEERAARS